MTRFALGDNSLKEPLEKLLGAPFESTHMLACSMEIVGGEVGTDAAAVFEDPPLEGERLQSPISWQQWQQPRKRRGADKVVSKAALLQTAKLGLALESSTNPEVADRLNKRRKPRISRLEIPARKALYRLIDYSAGIAEALVKEYEDLGRPLEGRRITLAALTAKVRHLAREQVGDGD